VTSRAIPPLGPTVAPSSVALRLAAELVRIPSVTGDERAGAVRVAALLGDRGWSDPRVVADTNVVSTIGAGIPRTCLLAYLDTPPPGAMRDPFDARIVDGAAFGRSGPVLRGRGAVTKGGLAAAIVAAETTAGAAAVRLAATSRDNDGLAAVLAQLSDRGAVHTEPTNLASGIETVAFGPGRIADLGDEEHIAAVQLAAAERVLAAFLLDSANSS
jgi:acetylornithine deacetylase/succinyl-diaminopimelate desuccinylase-like protein